MSKTSSPSRQEVWQMFDRIAHRYDFLNRVLSAGIDVSWRLKMLEYLPPKSDLKLLDLATGTGDVLITLCENHPQISYALGMDLSEGMLDIGRQKVQHLNTEVDMKVGDACHIECSDSSFDIVTISFGIRNVLDVSQSLSEMYRVLKPGGKALILEFSQPSIPVFKEFYFYYLRHILPTIGGLISGDSYAYKYLNQTIETFPSGQDFANLMINVGFQDVDFHPLTGGISTLYIGSKRFS